MTTVRRLQLVTAILLASLAPSRAARSGEQHPVGGASVRLLAEDLDDAARRLYREARDGSHDDRHEEDRAERRALARLQELSQATRHYREVVDRETLEREAEQMRRTAPQLDLVMSRYNSAVESFDELHPYPEVAVQFQIVGQRLSELVETYRFERGRRQFRELRSPRWAHTASSAYSGH